MHDPTEKSGHSGEKQNLTFTTDFPVSLQKEFDGTQEIPYAPDLRPSLNDLSRSPKGVTPRKATRRPNTGAKSHEETPPVAVEAPVEENVPKAPEVIKPAKPEKTATRKENKKQLRRAKGWVTMLLVLAILLFLTFAAVTGLEIWKRRQADRPDDPVDTSSEAVSDPTSEASDIDSGVSSETSSASGNENAPYLSSDVQLTVTQQEEAIPGKNGKPIFTTRISIPTLVYTQHPQIEAEMNRQLTEIFDKLVTSTKNLAEEYAANCIDTSYPGTFECSCTLACSRSDIVTLMVESYTYNGGATFLTTINCYNFKITDGRLLELDEVVDNRSALINAAIQLIDVELVHKSLYKNYISDNVCDEWYFSSNGLVLIYQQYSLSPGASGMIEVIIPDEDVEHMLTDEFKKPTEN